jgi:hypothetical protein
MNRLIPYPRYTPTDPEPGPPRWLILLFILILLALAVTTQSKQMQPDPKRIREIQAALIDHNYAPGKTWKETQDILRGIARVHHWQTHWAPDARVLILLGLSNNDPQIIDGERNRLDGGTSEVEN